MEASMPNDDDLDTVEIPKEIDDRTAQEADMIIVVKNGRALVVKDREEKGGEMSIGDLIGRLLREPVGQPGVFSRKF
jgi:hypothetical protein